MPPASLVTLPDEILLMICEDLCYHCYGTPQPSDDKFFNTNLWSLMRTCRRLRGITEPILYHCVWPGDNLFFLRTIIARPDLAVQVRSFLYDEADQRDALDEELDIMKAEARRLNINESDKWVRKWDREIKRHGAECDQRLLKLILTHLPNTKRLSIVVPLCEETTCLTDSRNKNITMESIHDLSLIPGDLFDLGLLGGFLTMMPCIERLAAYDCGSITKTLPLAMLRTLTLKNSMITATCLKTIVDSCPELEHFEYYVRPYDYDYTPSHEQQTVTCGQAQRILHSRRKTLKNLNLIFGKEFPPYLDHLENPELLSSLRDFDGLETLWVRTTDFGTDDEDEDVPIFPEDVEDLVSKLPQSLICLGFCGSHTNWDGIEILQEAILEGYFPNLEFVLLEHKKEEFEYARELLADVDVFCAYFNDTKLDDFPDCCSNPEFVEKEEEEEDWEDEGE
ncbi:hypothetical protein V8C43DRAFT_328602 [Trichoderma afarasin]